MTDKTDALLQAEEDANRLVDVLAILARETESYSTAGKALAGVTQDVGALTREIATAATALRDEIVTLRQIGTPALLDGQQSLAQQIEQSEAEAQSSFRSLIEQTREMVAGIRGMEASHQQGSDTILTEVRTLRLTADNVADKQQRGFAELQQNHAQQIGELRGDFQQMFVQQIGELREDWKSMLGAQGQLLADVRREIQTLKLGALVGSGVIFVCLLAVLIRILVA